MRVTQEISKATNRSTITLSDNGKAVINAQILLIAENNTFFEGSTNEYGICFFTDLSKKSFSVYIAHELYPAHAIDGYTPDKDLNVSIERHDNIGSLICPNRTGHIPGLEGRLNPILDTSNRMYLYADNIAINGGENQPATFEIGKPLTLEDRKGVSMVVVFLRIKGDSSLLQFKKIEESKNLNLHPKTGHIQGLIIEAGGNIINSGEILAHKDQFLILRAAKDVNHSGKIQMSDGSDRGLIKPVIIGVLIIVIAAAILFGIYKLTGVNLSSFH
jgi:hypothetical protein